MRFDVEEVDGRFVVTEVCPRVIGEFSDPAHAQLFLQALVERQAMARDRMATPFHEGADPTVLEEVVQGSATFLRRYGPGRAGGAVAASPIDVDDETGPAVSVPLEVETPVAPAAPGADRTPEELEADYQHALGRIDAGEGCKAVAEDMDLPFAKLRSRWALRVKERNAAEPPRPDKVAWKVASGWTDDNELKLLDVRDDPAALERLARELGRTVKACKARLVAIDRDTQGLMAGGA